MRGHVPNAGFDLSGFSWLPLPEKVHFQEGPGILAKDFMDAGVPLVRLSGLGGYEVTTKGCNFVSPEKGFGKWGHFRLKKGDILVSTSASFGRPAVVGEEAQGAIFYTGLIRFTPRTSDLDAGYLKAFLGSELFMRQAEALASGSVIRHFGPSHLREMRIPVPPLSDQRAIAATLGALDDKIELNRRMNETLEAMARALFRDWFVDFGPTRAKMAGQAPYLSPALWDLFPATLDDEGKPEGWEVFTLGQLAEHHTKNVNPLNHPSTAFEHFSLPAFDKDQSPALDLGATIKSNKTLMPNGSVLLSKLNPEIQRVWMPEQKTSIPQVCSTEFLVFTPRAISGRGLLFTLFSSEDFREALRSMVTGTSNSHQRISPPALVQREVLSGSSTIFAAFEALVTPSFDRISSNRAETRTLAQTRDLLLPRLMSGELRVADLDHAEKEPAA